MSGGYVVTPAPQKSKTTTFVDISMFIAWKGVILILDVQVDEFTLVLQTTNKPNYIEEWEGMANNIIKEFVKLSEIEIVMGELKDATYSLPQGYSNAFVCENVPYYFAIAYHADYIQMGVCI